MSRPPFCPSQFAMPAKGVAKRDPLLPWDGVALSYPTDATICRTGTAVAPCDNGAAADRLAGVRISDFQTLAIISIGRSKNQTILHARLLKTLTNLNIQLANRCPNFGRLPAGVIVLQNAAPPLLSRSIRAQMYGFFIFQHRQRLRDFRFSHRCDRLRILPIISAIWPVVQMVDNFPARVRTLTFLNI